ncbi:MAG: polysaccharide biosynthesis/export family protein [Planctomycetaceae bacterium]|nr:polysaccharide biosynthesis/export family protein [Planctomycetaceae bacterium]
MKNGSSSSCRLVTVSCVAVLLIASGCSSLQSKSYSLNIPAVEPGRLPPELLGRSREQMQQISISRLRQDPPPVYQLAANDVLGIYIENVLGGEGEAPPVHFPDTGDQPPAIGYPVPVREDGTLALPYVDPVRVEGLTLTQATEAVRRAYIAGRILQQGQDKIIVTLIRRREYRVTVIREEAGGKENVTKRGTGETVDLPAYENDVLHALNETGGLPGLDAKNEIYIIRGGFADGVRRDTILAQLNACREPCSCPLPEPIDPSVVRIPMRFYPEQAPQFTERDIILKTGDVVYIPARDTDKFYTGGALRGGEHLLPRDYDIDVLGAVALAGGQIASGGTGISRASGSGGGSGGAGGGAVGRSASRLIVLRKMPCGGQVPIKIDLNRALVDESERILVQPEDTLILQYTLCEEVYNAALNVVNFNFLFGLGGRGLN